MKKNFLKKIFIKLSRSLGYELIDQNEFYSPTSQKKLNENLSNHDKSIVLPLGEVKLSRKVESILILFRCNTNIEIWDQSKRRIFAKPKIEYTMRSLFSLIKSIQSFIKIDGNKNFKIKLKIINNGSTEENKNRIKNLIKSNNINFEFIDHKNSEHENIIKKQKNVETFQNLSSLLKCFEIAKTSNEDLVFFVEDDYLHFNTLIKEVINTYERICSQTKDEIFICPADYPYLYMQKNRTFNLIGSDRHWQTVDKTLCTFITSTEMIKKYWNNFYKNCLDRHEPFEKYINEIYNDVICISPMTSLSVHFTNINSSYGLAPFIDYKRLWEINDYNE